MSAVRAWLLTDIPQSRRQAQCQRFFLAWLVFRKNGSAVAGLAIVAALVAGALLAPWITGSAGVTPDLGDRLRAPGLPHWFGTDELGRDIFDRVMWGSRITLYIVGLVSVIVVPVGLAIGVVAGYVGGWVDSALMRLTDVFLAFPRLILALAFVAALGPGLENAVLAIALTSWSPYARIARAEALTLRQSDFILAARSQGIPHLRIIVSHVAPMCISSVVVRLTLDMAGIILTAAGLGFLGLGAQPPTPEWGAMIALGREYLLDQWWVPAFPGLAILVVSLGFNLLGDGLRDVLDPKSRD
ncbi:MAG: ABC transporter permease [Rhodospirillales bacterium]|nr:ABC transporter permease [Rhodospirillales bacterium]